MELRTIKNFSDNPLPIGEQSERGAMIFNPTLYWLDKNSIPVDLSCEIEKKDRDDDIGDLYRKLYQCLPTEVIVYNKSSKREVAVPAYVAIIENKDWYNHKPIYVVFSYLDGPSGLFQYYLHSMHTDKNNPNQRVDLTR